jgi:hypothetical protein
MFTAVIEDPVLEPLERITLRQHAFIIARLIGPKRTRKLN